LTKFFFWCYPWDLDEEGIEAAIDRMTGEIGVDALSVATTLHGISEFRARSFARQRTIEYDAAAHFQPNPRHYSNTRVRPIAAPWMKSRNPLDKISRHAEKQGLKLRAWTVCCHGSAMVARYPMTACINALGDASPNWMCPSNPDVREYVTALVEDLTTNYPVETMELEAVDFGGLPHAHRHVRTGIGARPLEQVLLSWCFCPSCRQRAGELGIDVDAVVAAATAHLGRMMRAEPPAFSEIDPLLACDHHLSAYHKMRIDAVTSLVRMLRGRTTARIVMHKAAPLPFSAADPSDLAEVCEGFIMPASYAAAIDGPHSPSPSVVPVERTEIRQQCYPPHVEDGPALVSAVYQAARSRFAAVGFANYGVAPEPCLDWVRQAVRYARREST
jgi:hypothetical protein